MTWLLVLAVAYLLIAVGSLVDKLLFQKSISRPSAYTFVVGLLGAVGVVIAPWGFTWPGTGGALLALLSGATFIAGAYWLFRTLKRNDASVTFPLIGGMTAIATYALSYVALGQRLGSARTVGIGLLIIGLVLVAWPRKGRIRISLLATSALAGVLYGISYTSLDSLYGAHGFVTGFVLVRVTSLLAACLFLLSRSTRRAVAELFKPDKRAAQGLILLSQGSNAVGFFVLNYAITLQSATW